MRNLQKTKKLILIALLLIFFAQHSIIYAQDSNSTEEKIYVKIEVNGMACAYCAYGLEKELKNVSGVNDVTIELKEGLALISTPKSQKPQKESLLLIIQNAGFTPRLVEYSDEPFLKKR